MRSSIALLALLPGAFLLGPAGAEAQQTASQPPRVVDRIVAVVGDSAIFLNELSLHVMKLESRGAQVPTDPAGREAFRRQALDNLVTETLLVQAAARDTLISVSPERVDAELQNFWDAQIRTFGTEAALRQELARIGMTPAQYRESQRVDLRNQQLIAQYVESQRRTLRIPPVEESQIREAFELQRASFGPRPAMVAFRQVVLVPTPSDSAKAVARAEAERILGLIREGQDFAELARRFSDDGSAQAGGDLGWVRPGMTVREFEQALFSLGRGEVSDVVETVYGAHIIRLDRIRGADRNARHILIAAETNEADVARTRARAQEIRSAVQAGTPILDFENEGEDLGLPRVVSQRPPEQLPPGYATELRGAQVGDVLGPIQLDLGQGRTAFAVVEVTQVREAGEWEYEDARDQIRAALQDQLFEDRLVERLRAETYVEIRY